MKLIENKELQKFHNDYLRWHPAQVASGDIDPVYPVLRKLADRWELDNEQRAWLVFCHVVWYHPGSTLVGFQIADDYTMLPSTEEGLWCSGLLDLPCETERRGHRPKQPLINHLLGLRERFTSTGGCWSWAHNAIEGAENRKHAWLLLNEALTTLVGNGRWAAYKTAEMLQKVCDFPVEAADAGHRYSSGPRKGLAILDPSCPKDNAPGAIAILDAMTRQWQELLHEPDVAQVETSLCDFNSLVHGRYYLGHDIDSMQHAFLTLGERIPPEAWEVRAEFFAHRFLGEFNDWTGVRKDANQHYKKTGELLWIP